MTEGTPRTVRAQMRGMTKRLIIESIAIGVLLVFTSVLQVSFFRVFGSVPALTLSLVCASGFICGEKTGAVCGITGGFFIDMLGAQTVILSPVIYMLAGFLCGWLVRKFLKKNLFSFMIFSVVVGLCRAAVTLGYLAFYTSSLNIAESVVRVLTPELLAFLICSPITYLLCLGVRKLTGIIIIKKKKYHLSKREDS